MERKIRRVVRSQFFDHDIADIYHYGLQTFGLSAANAFLDEVFDLVEKLSYQFYSHPECRFIFNENKQYHNIICGSYLIIYRITDMRIEVLRAFHGSRSPELMSSVRLIEL